MEGTLPLPLTVSKSFAARPFKRVNDTGSSKSDVVHGASEALWLGHGTP